MDLRPSIPTNVSLQLVIRTPENGRNEASLVTLCRLSREEKEDADADANADADAAEKKKKKKNSHKYCISLYTFLDPIGFPLVLRPGKRGMQNPSAR